MVIFSHEIAGFAFEIHKQRVLRFGVVTRFGKEIKRTPKLPSDEKARVYLNRFIRGHNRTNPNYPLEPISKKAVLAQTHPEPKVIAKVNLHKPMEDFRPLQRRASVNPMIYALEEQLRSCNA